ncbi:hypothetical protein Q4603_08155 [Zobellia galactanivorans]|uniref:Conserved hypothetical periplasmic protein n=1 Tax=Zobellia galactanivorans (strain DSM 12802 / CCUG 47099 / CIP 106680 / NCIMB 13871 / Dsij) TaxID=63186 RepID=G0LAC7_ZOBGA|nr:hypothetical protein [Zobellia galactanivorans]MBU3028295.1 hypothetical protein [Zobellia galactanivorans]MDO6808578.1 hypothetical protein [Zobellia galactanivorans]CAZ95225.1 Conserved hypothetical periplasmic protein [Zobellia galactanivorans]
MKEKLHRCLSCLMAIVLLLSTTSFKVEKHYCMGHLVDVAFFVDAQDCGMDMPLGDDMPASVEKSSCCASEVIAMEGQNDVKPSFNDFQLDQKVFLVAYTYSYIGLFEPLTKRNQTYAQYHPPKIVENIQLLDQVFLI